MLENKDMTAMITFSDFGVYPNLAVKLQRLFIEREIKIVDVKPTYYIVSGPEHLLESIYK